MTLVAYTIGLVPFVLIRSVVAPFLARGDTATPVKAALIGTAVNIAFKVALMVPLAQVGLGARHLDRRLDQFHPGAVLRGAGALIAPDAALKSSLIKLAVAGIALAIVLVDRRPARHGAVILVVQVPQRIGVGAVGGARRRGLWEARDACCSGGAGSL